jgi:hypothetical protein
VLAHPGVAAGPFEVVDLEAELHRRRLIAHAVLELHVDVALLVERQRGAEPVAPRLDRVVSSSVVGATDLLIVLDRALARLA